MYNRKQHYTIKKLSSLHVCLKLQDSHRYFGVCLDSGQFLTGFYETKPHLHFSGTSILSSLTFEAATPRHASSRGLLVRPKSTSPLSFWTEMRTKGTCSAGSLFSPHWHQLAFALQFSLEKTALATQGNWPLEMV